MKKLIKIYFDIPAAMPAAKIIKIPRMNPKTAPTIKKNYPCFYPGFCTFSKCSILSHFLFCHAHSFPFKPNQILQPRGAKAPITGIKARIEAANITNVI